MTQSLPVSRSRTQAMGLHQHGTAKTFCRNCGAQYAIEVHIEDGRMVRAGPDATASPFGACMCPKGLAAIDLDKGAGGLGPVTPEGHHTRITAETALDEITVRLCALVAEHGPPRAFSDHSGSEKATKPARRLSVAFRSRQQTRKMH